MKKKKLYITLLIALVILAGGLLYYTQSRKDNPQRSDAKTTSNQSTAQSGYSDGKDRQVTGSNSVSQGGAIDKNGSTTNTQSETDPSLWNSSADKAITVQQPITGQKLVSGATLRGTTNLNSVYYRLIDSQNGVIAQGQLTVNNSNFSGLLQFKSYSQDGVLDVYGIDQSSGREVSRIEFKVAF